MPTYKNAEVFELKVNLEDDKKVHAASFEHVEQCYVLDIKFRRLICISEFLLEVQCNCSPATEDKLKIYFGNRTKNGKNIVQM